MSKEKPNPLTIKALHEWADLQSPKFKDADLGRKLNTSGQTIHNWKVRGGIPAARHRDAAKLMGITIEDLNRGIIETRITNPGRTVIYAIPVRCTARLNQKGDWVATQLDEIDGFISMPSADVDAYCVRIMGDTLRPRIKSGDFVVISPNHPYGVTDEVMVTTVDGTSMIKEFLFERDGMVALQDINGLGARLTQTGVVMGTPMYMSPDQILGREPDARSDIYSLGVLAYTLVAGRENNASLFSSSSASVPRR